MLDDGQLLRRYVDEGSEAAFGELVARHVNLVYSAALRRTNGDTHLAQDAAQLVFTDLAWKARFLPGDVMLAGWLHRATRYAAAQLLRTERRRVAREQEAVAMNILESEIEPDWEQIRPLLDEALDELGRDDRDALLLRFFEKRSLAEVGRAIGANEDAARKRVNRALEKLRTRLIRRGLKTSAVALSGVLPLHAIQAAPVGLAATLTSTSIAGVAAETGTTLTLLKFITVTKLKAGIVSALVVAGVATSLVIQHHSQARLREVDEFFRQQADRLARLEVEHERLMDLAGKAAVVNPNNLEELQRLRIEAANLRSRSKDLAKLREEDQQLQVLLAKARQDMGNSNSRQTVWSDEAKAKSEYSLRLALAMMQYASDHNEQFPSNFDQTKTYNQFPTNSEQIARLVSVRTGQKTEFRMDQFELVYEGSRAALTNYAHPGSILLVRERQPWKNTDGQWVKVYAFTDGSGQVHPEADRDFEAWEKRHIIPPASTKE